MSLVIWDAKFDLGVDEMNDEHKQLILIMNYLYDQNAAGATKPELIRIMKALGAYTERHFSDEEAYMESIGYEGLESHKLLHLNLLKSLCRNARGYVEAKDTQIPDELFRFLRGWLAAHIMKVDMKYGEHAQTQRHHRRAA